MPSESPYALEAKVFGCISTSLLFLFALAVLFGPGGLRAPEPVPNWFAQMMCAGGFGMLALSRFLFSLKPRTRHEHAGQS